jgi:hypothetical protein
LATSPGRTAFLPDKQAELDERWRELDRLRAQRRPIPGSGLIQPILGPNGLEFTPLFQSPGALSAPTEGDESRWENESRLQDEIQRLSNNPGWWDAGRDLRDEGAQSYDAYGADPTAKNFSAQAGRAVAGLLNGVAYGRVGQAGAVAQMGAQAYESTFGDTERRLRESGVNDPQVIAEEANRAGINAVASQTPWFAAFLIGGSAASQTAAKLSRYAPQFARPLIEGTAATAANALVNSAQNAYEGHGSLPDREQFLSDALWGYAYHGYGNTPVEGIPGASFLNPWNYELRPLSRQNLYGLPVPITGVPRYRGPEPYISFNKSHQGVASPRGLSPNGVPLQSHHGLQAAWANANLGKFGYSDQLAPTVTIETGQGFSHTGITNSQNARQLARETSNQGSWSSSIDEELQHIVDDFGAQGFRKPTIRKVLQQNYDMLDEIGVPYRRPKGY